MLNQVFTVSEVAKLRNQSAGHVRLLLARGHWGIEARRTDEGVWLITNPLKGVK